METALVTGMLDTEFLPIKQAKTDVKESNTGSFSAIFESSMKNKEVTNDKKEVKSTDDEKINVSEGTEEKVQDVEVVEEETTEEIKEDSNKKDKRNKKEELIFENQIADVIRKDVELKQEDVNTEEVLIKDVELENKDVITLVGSIKNGELEITPEEKLDNLLSKLDVKLTKNVEIKDDSEKVIKVGPQSVETEKIELNIKDVENKIKNNDIQNNLFISKNNNFNNPEIQNPFKLKKSTENIEINEDVLNEKVLKDEALNGEESFVNSDNLKFELSKDVLNEDVENKEKLNKDILNKDILSKDVDVNTKDVVIKEVENKDVLEKLGNSNEFEQKNFNDNNSDSKEFEKKEEKIKVKDFRNKAEVEFADKFNIEKDVEIDNKFEIKNVDNIRKFENLNFEQDVLDQVTEKLEVSLFDNKSEMVIKLKPNDLGRVTVKISIENGVMNAKFLADSIKVKEALESNMNNLKESLKDQGLNVQDLNVSVDSGRSQNQAFEQKNVRYFNNRKENKVDDVISYEDTYYEFSNINTNNVRSYWMDSTVSFLA